MATLRQSIQFPTTELKRALASSIDGGTFVDTAYYLYTTRLKSSKVGKPRVVHANRQVMQAAAKSLKSSESLTSCILILLRTEFPAELVDEPRSNCIFERETQDYGYDSDSDLDDSDGSDSEETSRSNGEQVRDHVPQLVGNGLSYIGSRIAHRRGRANLPQ